MRKALLILVLLMPSLLMAQGQYSFTKDGICGSLEEVFREDFVSRTHWELKPGAMYSGPQDFEVTLIQSDPRVTTMDFISTCVAAIGYVTGETDWSSTWLYMNVGDGRWRILTAACRRIVQIARNGEGSEPIDHALSEALEKIK